MIIPELVKAVELDPAITARLLAIANSAYYQTTHAYTHVKDAIVRLGIVEVKQLLLPIILASFFDTKKCPKFRADLYWKQALLVALGTRKIAECAGSKMPKDLVRSAYTAGLLHNIGYLALVHLFPDDMNSYFNMVIENETSKAALKIDPGRAGYLLLSSWGVPEDICAVARDVDDRKVHRDISRAPLTTLVNFVITWYQLDFCALEATDALTAIKITTADITKAHSQLHDEIAMAEKLADMLHHY